MSAPVTYRPEVVAGWQPRAQHYYHEAGSWHGPSYTAWIDQRIAEFTAEHGIPADNRLRGHQEAFTAWLAERCPCAGSVS